MAARQKTKPSKTSPPSRLIKYLPWLLLIGGVIGVIAAGFLSVDYVTYLKNPSYQPVCNLNPIFSCSNVMTSDQAHAFGLPNEFIGMAGYAAVATTGLVLLAGAAMKKWYWQLFNFGLLLAVAFLTWLQFQTLYRIGALCIFCMIVWIVSIPMFWYTTLYNLREGNIPTPARLKGTVNFIQRHHFDILIVWFLIIILLILKRFWYYWSTLI
jgi:uncharacterized membrane protein